MTVLDRALGPASCTGGRCPAGSSGPEVPERARRRSFTARYKLDVLAAYDAAAQGEKGAICAGRACIPVTSLTGGEPGTLASGRPGPGEGPPDG